jgi:hypothetical protein
MNILQYVKSIISNINDKNNYKKHFVNKKIYLHLLCE